MALRFVGSEVSKKQTGPRGRHRAKMVYKKVVQGKKVRWLCTKCTKSRKKSDQVLVRDRYSHSHREHFYG
jgi:hypothetical protein